jgi:hypothetical protein
MSFSPVKKEIKQMLNAMALMEERGMEFNSSRPERRQGRSDLESLHAILRSPCFRFLSVREPH